MSPTADESRRARSRAAPSPPVPSPLDPFLSQFLRWAVEQPRGFTQSAANASAAEAFGWQVAFAEAVFISARVRGLIGPYYGKGARGRSRWHLSKRGHTWLAADSSSPDADAENST